MKEHEEGEEALFDEALLLEVLENQLADNHPKRVKETLLRLTMTGHSREEAMLLMACALAEEIMTVTQQQVTSDEKRYAAMLDQLPEMPWADEE